MDTEDIIGVLGDKPPLMRKRVSLKINEAREIYKKLLYQDGGKLNQFGRKIYFPKLYIKTSNKGSKQMYLN